MKARANLLSELYLIAIRSSSTPLKCLGARVRGEVHWRECGHQFDISCCSAHASSVAVGSASLAAEDNRKGILGAFAWWTWTQSSQSQSLSQHWLAKEVVN